MSNIYINTFLICSFQETKFLDFCETRMCFDLKLIANNLSEFETIPFTLEYKTEMYRHEITN